MSDEYSGITEETDFGVQNDGEPTAVVEEPKAETPVEAEEPKSETETQPETEEEKPKKPGSRRAREKAARLEAENEALRAALANQKPQEQAKPNPVVNDGRPKAEDFESFEDFQEALTDWKVNKALETRDAEARARQQQEIVAKKVKIGREKYEDFDDDLADIMPLAANHPVGMAITESDHTEDLIHYFAENIEDLERIRALSPTGIGREIAKLEAKFVKPSQPNKPTSQAPPPVKPIAPSAAVNIDTKYKGIEEF